MTRILLIVLTVLFWVDGTSGKESAAVLTRAAAPTPRVWLNGVVAAVETAPAKTEGEVKLPDPNGYQSIGWLLVSLSALLVIYNQIRSAITGGKPQEIAQPIQIEHVAQFVKVEHFNSKFSAIERRLNEQVQASDKYLHEMRHELREEMQATTLKIEDVRETVMGSVGKAHGRIDDVAESLGEMRGEMRQVSSSLSSIDGLLRAKAIGGGK